MPVSLSLGLVSSCAPDALCVQADSQFLSIPVLSPWGFASVPPEHSQAAVLSCGLSDFSIGSPQQPAPGLLPGEVLLSSGGGACIRLCQNGDVIINGHTFPLPPKEDA